MGRGPRQALSRLLVPWSTRRGTSIPRVYTEQNDKTLGATLNLSCVYVYIMRPSDLGEGDLAYAPRTGLGSVVSVVLFVLEGGGLMFFFFFPHPPED